MSNIIFSRNVRIDEVLKVIFMQNGKEITVTYKTNYVTSYTKYTDGTFLVSFKDGTYTGITNVLVFETNIKAQV